MIWWKIYYANGKTFSNLDGDFLSAPSWGILAIACADETHIRALDLVGLLDYGTRGLVTIKVGRSVPNNVYAPILDYARHDPDLPNDRVILEGSDFYAWVEQ